LALKYEVTSKFDKDYMKFAPKELVSLINLTNHICPGCGVPLSGVHLRLKHSIPIPDMIQFIKSLDGEARGIIARRKSRNLPVNRVEIIESSGHKVREFIGLIKAFLQKGKKE